MVDITDYRNTFFTLQALLAKKYNLKDEIISIGFEAGDTSVIAVTTRRASYNEYGRPIYHSQTHILRLS